MMEWQTHEVTNQAPELQDTNLYPTDIELMMACGVNMPAGRRTRVSSSAPNLAAGPCSNLANSPTAAAPSGLASRMDGECGRVYGTLAFSGLPGKMLERAWPMN
jgi:hypothetical protein